MKVQKYCLGFLFDPERRHVVLIRKNRPEWAQGLFNGIGGKFRSQAEHPEAAMAREFHEEAGLYIAKWRQFALMTGNGSEVHIFEAASESAAKARQRTDEPVVIMPVEIIITPQLLVPSLTWMIPLALDPTKHVFIQSTRQT